MARKVSFIGEVNDKQDTWKIKVRVTDLWHVMKYNTTNSIEAILLKERVTFFFLIYIFFSYIFHVCCYSILIYLFLLIG